MFFRSLICGVLLVLGLAYAQFAGAAVQKAAAAATTARYKGNYFFFVINPQNFFQYGGIFNIATNGTVVGWIFNNQNVATAITPGTTITNNGRFAVDLVQGANITTLTVGCTATGTIVGRQETPGQFYILSGAMYNSFYREAGIYRGTLNDGRQMVMAINLQRRTLGSFEQTVGNFTPLFGSGNRAGVNGRSYLAVTFFNGLWDTNSIPGAPNGTSPIIGNGTWRDSGVGGANGTFNLRRQNATTAPFQPDPPPP